MYKWSSMQWYLQKPLSDGPNKKPVPIQVATKLASIRKPTFLAPSPETYARAAVRYIGYEPRCTPYWGHALVWLLISLVPEPIADRMFLNRSISIRAKGRAKEAKKKAQ
ncbi:unnamed protein product [Miscanthus lutarioriparius]|uniref:Uncharacterized protein n=1 Tax=Miscanthus lutarioriparius TaxID=422564 RepID=A0A811QW78_9POAL|nr:unnamed protein product [Miscanthus lutarioriparius]